ncbi:MAG: hypothetical protein P4M11_09460 [Candidatus Pacebacteria bacterium]|nr:hypothetical protein [Candidatus Paceibacterota bacterium]
MYDTILSEVYGLSDYLMRFHHLLSNIAAQTAILNKYGCSSAVSKSPKVMSLP